MSTMTARQALSAILANSTPLEAAARLGVHNAHVYNAIHGKVSPTLVDALRQCELIPEPARRRRYHFVLDEEDEREFLEWRERRRFTEADIGDIIMWEIRVAWRR